MKALLLITLIVAALACVRAADVDESDVVVGTGANFKQEIADGPTLVEFYAPWCGHCKRLTPEYAKAATALKGEVKLVKVDATVESSLASEFGVQGYPTIKFFKSGKLAGDYDGERTAEAIVSWCRKRSGPAAAPVDSKATYDQWAAKNSGTKIVAFAEQDSEAHKTILSVAGDAAVDEFAFAVMFDKNTAAEVHAGAAFPGVVLFKGTETLKYEGNLDTEDLLAWVLKNGYPVIEELSQGVFKRASTSQRPLFVGFTNPETGNEAEQLELFTTIANNLAGKAMFSHVAHNKFPNLASQWGASGNKYPTAVFVTWPSTSPKIRAFDEADEFTAEAVTSWVEQCLEGTCKAFRKSEPIPESNDGPVTVVVGKTFEDVVLDTTKDVFVEFYAPWCGHCKKLAPIYDQLGQRFSNIDSVVIAKTDATANGFPDNINVRGFPTLLFFKADDKANPVSFDGDRDLASLEKFVIEQASVEIDTSKLAAVGDDDEDHDEL